MLFPISLKALCLQLLLSIVTASDSPADKVPEYRRLPPLRKQAAIQDAWRSERICNIPNILQKHGVDAWLMSQKEYAEDTVFWSLKRATQFSARRRTTQLFFANANSSEQLAYSWIDITPNVWSNLRDVLEAHNPSKIAVNIDSEVAFSSGLHSGELKNIETELGEKWSSRLVNEPMIAVEYIGTMVQDRLPWYRILQETAWAIISEGFSEKVVTPGKTSTEDVEWWMRDKIQQLNYTTWFMPSVSILRGASPFKSQPLESDIINFGDVLHVDFGVTAMGLNTDTQHLGYVLYPGESESDIPQGLINALKTANRLQDIVKSRMKPGISGNTVLGQILQDASNENIGGQIYCHPIGDWGHSAGSLIGMMDLQDGIPVLGDLPILKNTYYSIELYAEAFVPERNETMIIPLEEDVYWVNENTGWDWVYGQQKKFHFVKTPRHSVFRVQGELSEL